MKTQLIQLKKLYDNVKDGTLSIYVAEDIEWLGAVKRHTVIVCPGGGYGFCSDREGEIVALSLVAAGFNACVLNYTCCNGCYPYPMNEVEASIDYLEKNSEELRIKDISIMGFSAGGHLASYVGYTTKHEIKNVILGYPVITMGEYTHQGTKNNLLGDKADELADKFSVENVITPSSPRTFIFTTVDDNSVPFENTLFLVNALRKNNVSFELHAYEHGCHGLSLANELVATSPAGINPNVQHWVEAAINFIKNTK